MEENRLEQAINLLEEISSSTAPPGVRPDRIEQFLQHVARGKMELIVAKEIGSKPNGLPIYINTDEAVKVVEIMSGRRMTTATIRNWAIWSGIGKKLGGRWLVNKQKLIEFIRTGKC